MKYQHSVSILLSVKPSSLVFTCPDSKPSQPHLSCSVFSSVSRFASYRACLVLATILYITDTLLSQRTPGTYCMFPQCTFHLLSTLTSHTIHPYPSLCSDHLSLFSYTSSPYTHACILSSSLWLPFLSLPWAPHSIIFPSSSIIWSLSLSIRHKLQALTTGLKLWLS